MILNRVCKIDLTNTECLALIAVRLRSSTDAVAGDCRLWEDGKRDEDRACKDV